MARKGNNNQARIDTPQNRDEIRAGAEAQGSGGPGSTPREPGNGSGKRSDGDGRSMGESSGSIFSSDQIAERAYQIFEREGRMDGRDMDHWLAAERELRLEREQRTRTMSPENAPRSERQHQRGA